MMGVQKHIENDVLGEVHAFALDMHDIQSSKIEEWLIAMLYKKFAGRTLVVDENSTDYRLCIMLEAKAPFCTPTWFLMCLYAQPS